jgi:hypothetical protein
VFKSIFSILKAKNKTKTEDKTDEITHFIPTFDDIQDFKSQHNLTCPARTTGELTRYLEPRPNQKAISNRLLSLAKNHTEKRTAINKKRFVLIKIMQMLPW